jgi:hypothetical protein
LAVLPDHLVHPVASGEKLERIVELANAAQRVGLPVIMDLRAVAAGKLDPVVAGRVLQVGPGGGSGRGRGAARGRAWRCRTGAVTPVIILCSPNEPSCV